MEATQDRTSATTKTVTLKAGTIVKISGMPLTLTQDTPVETHEENVALINKDYIVGATETR